jgi:multiple sugar transport system permease protein
MGRRQMGEERLQVEKIEGRDPVVAGAGMAMPGRKGWRGGMPREASWAFILALPALLVLALFVVYPIAYGFYLGSNLDSYRRLLDDPIYMRTMRNTLVFVGLAVNIKLFLALLLSGYFFNDRRWIAALFLIFILPWAVPSIPTILSFRWMLNSEWGMLNNILDDIGIGGQLWLLKPNLGIGSAIAIHIWKWLPFWTLILLAGRMAIPQDIYEAAALDGASGVRGFLDITFPLLSGLYVTCTLLSAVWTLGDFNSIYLLTGGGPFDTTHVFATLSIRYAFIMGDLKTGVAVAITALPVVIPVVYFLVRRLREEN